MRPHMDNQAFHKAFECLWQQVAAADVYINEQAPWKLRKEDPDRMKTVLYVCAEAVRQFAILMQPIMPESMDKMLTQMNIDDRSFESLGEVGRLAPGTAIPKPQGVFTRFTGQPS